MNLDTAFPIIKETIPKSLLGYNSNNVYEGFPPLMSDSRAVIASYQPDAVTNEQIIADNGIKSNWQYRQYLQARAPEIMQQNMRKASNDFGYFDRYADFKTNGGNVLRYETITDNRKPIFYSDSDLKRIYLSREQLNALKMAPVMK